MDPVETAVGEALPAVRELDSDKLLALIAVVLVLVLAWMVSTAWQQQLGERERRAGRRKARRRSSRRRKAK